MNLANKQAKGKDPAVIDYGLSPTYTVPSRTSPESSEQRGVTGWEDPKKDPPSFEPEPPPASNYPRGIGTGIREPEDKDTGPDLLDGARRPPYFVQPGSDRDRPVPPKATIEPVRSYGYAPPQRETPTKDIPAQGRRAQFILPLSGEQNVGDPVSQGRPSIAGNGGRAGPGGHGPIKYVTGPDPKAPPSATKQPPFDIVGRKAPEAIPISGTMLPAPSREKPKTDLPGYTLPRILYPKNPSGPVTGGSGTVLTPAQKGLVNIGFRPKPKMPGIATIHSAEREPADGPQVGGRNYATPQSRAGQTLAPPNTDDPAGLKLFQRQRKPDPDETKAGNQ